MSKKSRHVSPFTSGKPNASASHSTICSQVETITPSIARQLLASMNGNRHVTQASVDTLVREIRAKRWRLNGEPIIIDWDGHMVDGQHRCEAVIKCDLAIDSLVVRGVDPSAFLSIDTGRSRTVGDSLSISGEVNANALAAALRGILRMSGGHARVAIGKMTPQDAVTAMELVPNIRHWVSRFVSTDARKIMPSNFAAVLAVMEQAHGAEVTEAFLVAVCTGANLAHDSPVLHLLRRRRTVHDTLDMTLALSIKAAAAYARGIPMRMLRWKSDEAFPTI